MSAREPVEEAFVGHGAYERDGDAFVVGTTAFEASVRVLPGAADPSGGTDGDGAGAPAVVVTVRVPTIDAVVAGETVAPVVQEGWYETFERRLEDVAGVTRLDPAPPTVSLDDRAGEVVVETTLSGGRPPVLAEDAKAVVDYVEGTFVEGIIPGYTYREPAAGLIDRARAAGER